MTLDPYHHEHAQVEEISWSRLGELLIRMAEKIAADWRPEIVVGIAKGGVVPGVFLSSAFRVDFLPVKLSSRQNGEIVSERPIWHVLPTEHVRGKQVLLVDDIVLAGRTLSMAEEELRKQGAKEVRTAALAAHSGSVRADYVLLVTDALIVWPWDRDVLSPEGAWQVNPEYLQAMRQVSGYSPGPSPAF